MNKQAVIKFCSVFLMELAVVLLLAMVVCQAILFWSEWGQTERSCAIKCRANLDQLTRAARLYQEESGQGVKFQEVKQVKKSRATVVPTPHATFVACAHHEGPSRCSPIFIIL